MELLTEQQIRTRMSAISERYPDERKRLKEAYEALAKKEALVHLAITFKEPTTLSNEKARDYLQNALESGYKLTESDKKALVGLELEAEQLTYDLAKFDCETSEKDFKLLDPQLSYYQTELRITS
jgi:hypothetical protein